MGLYTPDEIEEYAGTPIEPKDVSPNLMQRLPGAAQQLDREVVDNALATHANEPEPEKPAGAKGKRQRKSKATPEPTAAKTTGEVYAEASGVKAGTIRPCQSNCRSRKTPLSMPSTPRIGSARSRPKLPRWPKAAITANKTSATSAKCRSRSGNG